MWLNAHLFSVKRTSTHKLTKVCICIYINQHDHTHTPEVTATSFTIPKAKRTEGKHLVHDIFSNAPTLLMTTQITPTCLQYLSRHKYYTP